MPFPAAAPIQHCAICHQPLAGQATVPTTMGGAVHICCADRETLAAARSRTFAALVSGGLLMAVWSWGLAAEGGDLSVVLGLALLLILHIQLNQRWWQELMRWALGMRARRPAENRRVASQGFIQPNDSAETRRKSTGWHESGGGYTPPAEDATC